VLKLKDFGGGTSVVYNKESWSSFVEFQTASGGEKTSKKKGY